MIELHSMSFARKGHKPPHPSKPHFHPHLFIVFLQRSKIFSSFGEFAFFHAFTHIVMHEGTLRIPWPNTILDRWRPTQKSQCHDQILSFLTSEHGAHPAETVRTWKKKLWGDSNEASRRPYTAISTWKENCFPPTWRVGFGSITYLVIPGCFLPPCMQPAWVDKESACFLPQRVSHSSSPRAVTTSWWDLAPKKYKRTTPHWTGFYPRGRWSDQVKKGAKNAFWQLQTQLSKNAPRAQAPNAFELKFSGAFSSIERMGRMHRRGAHKSVWQML